uniref:Nibrin n=1 Tax=Calidris pygmaea TaxID=425635 RepID=A0A8C3PPB5_9CHAR
MWKLVSATGKGEPYWLLSGTEYVVGRKNCAILIQDDQSISRSHAVLTVSRPETPPSQSLPVPVLTVTDKSKYGTFVNGSKLDGTSVSLQSGDRINFGVFESKFRIEYEPLVVCSSCLDTAQKTALNQAIWQLGGLVVNEWTKECTHLVMVSVKVTVKTICALICGRPIIKPEFFVELIRAIQSRQQLPKHENFYPPVDEPSIGTEKLDLSEHHERKKIFSGKTFVFLTAKQHKKLGPAVILGGGEAKLMTEGRKETSFLTSPEVCVVDVGLTNSQVPESDSARNWTDSILAVLKSKNIRAIPEAEIGLAVIFMSTEKYCNPQKQLGNKGKWKKGSSKLTALKRQYFFLERAEEGEETSVSKLAKVEKRSSPVSQCTERAASSVWNSEAQQHQKQNKVVDPNPHFALEDTGIKFTRESSKLGIDKTDAKTTSSEKHALKRKELDDLSEDTEALEIVFGSRDLDWEDQMADHDQEAQGNTRKKRCLEAKGSGAHEVNVKQREENKTLVSLYSSSNRNELQDDSSNLPSRLLLTEFRSLVVSHPRQSSQLTGNASYGGKKNFKTFKKVSYPGAGQLPYIIGGSDLIAHHAKKNSELEDWLRQEMEEQNRHIYVCT